MSLWLVSDNGGRIMLVVNLFGAPGAGKSTGAAYIFSKLKMLGINTELVTEFAKDKAWENNMEALSDQIYVFGEQHYRINRCANKVDVIITDSPLLLSVVYNQSNLLKEEFNHFVANVFQSYHSINYFIERTKPYSQSGRLQTKAESDRLSRSIEAVLLNYHVEYRKVTGSVSEYDKIIDDIRKELRDNLKGVNQ